MHTPDPNVPRHPVVIAQFQKRATDVQLRIADHRLVRGPRAMRSGAFAEGQPEPPPMQARWCDQPNSWLISTTFPSGSVV
jgi:hypothetical protein